MLKVQSSCHIDLCVGRRCTSCRQKLVKKQVFEKNIEYAYMCMYVNNIIFYL